MASAVSSALLLIAIVLFIILSVWKKVQSWLRVAEKINRIPGPAGRSLFGLVWRLARVSREDFSLALFTISKPFALSGPLFKAWLGPMPVVLISKAEAAKVLLSHQTEVQKSSVYKLFHRVFGTGLLTSNGVKWRHRRKLIAPSFGHRVLENFLPLMNEQANLLVEILERNGGKMFDICPFVTRCTLDIICETAMGQGVGAQLNPDSQYFVAINNVAHIFWSRVFKPWLYSDWIFRFTPMGQLEEKYSQIMRAFSRKIVGEKRAKMLQSKGGKKSGEVGGAEEVVGLKRRVALLDTLLEKSMAEEDSGAGGHQLSDEDIREEVDTFIPAGHDTTAASVNWTIYWVGQHPQIQQRLLDELDAVLGDDVCEITSDHLHRLKYLDCVTKESMRLTPPIPLYSRQLNENMAICGYDIPAGVLVAVVPYFVHRDPEQFPEPETFDPDRFLPDNSRDREPFAFIPFSAGPRNCIGHKFAVMEEKVILIKIFRRFNVRTVVEVDHVANMQAEIVLRPKRGVKVILEPRNKRR